MKEERKVIFGQMLDYFRKQNNLTMEDLGNAIGRTRSTISRWVSGERYPKIEEVEQLVALFNTDTETLLFGAQSNKPSQSMLIPLDKKLGNRIKQFREEKGVSQELLVKTLGISLNDLKSYEMGQKPFTVNTVFHFADALGVTFDDLFPNTTTEYFNEIPAILYLDEENNTIITTNGKKYVVSDKEMQQAKDFLTFLHRK